MTSPCHHPGCAKAGRRVRSRSQQAGFSLVEIMIAIAILGFGLVMVATMFPIAWQRARTMAEFTSQTAAVESAHTSLKLLLHVDSPNTTLYIGSSFAGDLVEYEDPPGSRTIVAYPDQRVHLLHMENLLVSPRGFYPQRNKPESAANPPYLLEKMDSIVDVDYNELTSFDAFYITDFGAAQIRFEERVYPPLRPRENVDAATGEFMGDDPTWDATLATRRFAWVAFHRLLKPIPKTGNPDTECVDGSNQGCPAFLAQAREFDMYYATVKRSRLRTRYAQQNPDSAPNPTFPNDIVVPVALPADDDVMLPTPWRVQIYIPNPPLPDSLANPDESPKSKYIYVDGRQVANSPRVGVPTIAEVNTSHVTTAPFVVDFFQRGTKFIDEVNGAIYEVVNRRLKTGSNPDDVEAFLTLDKEIVLVDLIDPTIIVDPPIAVPQLVPQLIRTVWVFPPPVESERLSDDTPIFAGSPPVIDIDKRILSVAP